MSICKQAIRVTCFLMLTAAVQIATAAAPTYVDAGNVMQSTGAITVPWPAHVAGDVALLVIESANQTISLSTPAGFVEVTGSPQGTGTAGGTSATRLAVYWKRATTSAEAQPTVADSGDHQIARMFTFRGVISSGNPWDVTAGNVLATASTAVSIPGATTTVADTRVVVIVPTLRTRQPPRPRTVANANLTSLADVQDNNTSQGNGGGFGDMVRHKIRGGCLRHDDRNPHDLIGSGQDEYSAQVNIRYRPRCGDQSFSGCRRYRCGDYDRSKLDSRQRRNVT